MSESGVTGCILNFVDNDRVSTYDIIELCLKCLRICNPTGASDQALDEPISLDMITSGQLHAAPDALPELRHPLHGVLSGVARAGVVEFIGAEIRLLDIEPP